MPRIISARSEASIWPAASISLRFGPGAVEDWVGGVFGLPGPSSFADSDALTDAGSIFKSRAVFWMLWVTVLRHGASEGEIASKSAHPCNASRSFPSCASARAR